MACDCLKHPFGCINHPETCGCRDVISRAELVAALREVACVRIETPENLISILADKLSKQPTT